MLRRLLGRMFPRRRAATRVDAAPPRRLPPPPPPPLSWSPPPPPPLRRPEAGAVKVTLSDGTEVAPPPGSELEGRMRYLARSILPPPPPPDSPA